VESAGWPGDSGAPLVDDREGAPLLVGILGRSGLGELPDLVTRLAPYREWIEGVIAGDLRTAVPCFRSPARVRDSGAT